jgi:hypothetical protein
MLKNTIQIRWQHWAQTNKVTTNNQQAEHLHSIPPSFTVRGPSSLGAAYFFTRAN